MFKFPKILKAIGHPERQKILNLIKRKKELSVSELVKQLNLSQSTISYHLSVLKNTGIILAREEGAQTFYSICCKAGEECCSNLKKFFKEK